jgi:hypothetical protein
VSARSSDFAYENAEEPPQSFAQAAPIAETGKRDEEKEVEEEAKGRRAEEAKRRLRSSSDFDRLLR